METNETEMPTMDAATRRRVCTCDWAERRRAWVLGRGATPAHAPDCPVRLHNAEARKIWGKICDAQQAADRAAEAERAARLDARQAACPHDDCVMISHEEKRCRHCGAILFVPDWD